MNYFDTRTSRALMESRIQEAEKASSRRPLGLAILGAVRDRLGNWMIARGEKLVSKKPKIA